MPTDIAILNAALKSLKELRGMDHPSDKKAMVWTFKLLKKHGVSVDVAVVRQSMLDAGMY